MVLHCVVRLVLLCQLLLITQSLTSIHSFIHRWFALLSFGHTHAYSHTCFMSTESNDKATRTLDQYDGIGSALPSGTGLRMRHSLIGMRVCRLILNCTI